MLLPMTTAVVFDQYGPPEVLRFAELPDPQAGPGQLRVRVKAAGVQPFDVGVRRGAMAAGCGATGTGAVRRPP